MASEIPSNVLNVLFPLPRVTHNISFPVLSAGYSSASAEALVKFLKENHERFHIFFNKKGFHNHVSHHLYAIYALGAPPDVLEAAFKSHAVYQRLAFDSPRDITVENWTEHLEDERYYRAFLKFFSKVVLQDGVDATLDKYVFSTSANWVEGLAGDKKQPQMVNRLLSGVLHPFIHIGHALEFSSPGMLAEGLAMACTTRSTDFDELVPKSLFVKDDNSLITNLASALSLSGNASKGTHSFTIVARMLNDPDLAQGAACVLPTQRTQTKEGEGEGEGTFPLIETLKKRGELIKKYADEWNTDVHDQAEAEAKLEELFVLVTLLYGVVGLPEGAEAESYKADFFLMHLVTSSLFLPSFLPHLKPASRSILLRTFLASALAVWVARGRPTPNITSFYSRTSPSFNAPGPQPSPGPDVLAPASAVTPDFWLPVLQTILVHPNEHAPKAFRALAHFARVLGGRPAGTWAGTELVGAEELDGTLFVRVAGLTVKKLGWVREGEPKGEWDFSGFWE